MASNLYNETKDTILKISEIIKNNNIIDFSDVWFLNPLWYCLIKTYVKDRKIDFDNLIFTNSVEEFIDKIWFFDNNYKLWWEVNKRKILPIYSINWWWETDEVEEISNKFYEQLDLILEEDKKYVLQDLVMAISELLNNIEHHSEKTFWLVAENYSSAQIYSRNKQCLQIAIIDSWIWIFSSIREKYNIQNTQEAILKSLEKWVTWTTQLEKWNSGYHNQWLWLFKTKEIIKKLNWDLFIWTKDSLYTFDWENEEFENLKNNWRWTFIVLNIDFTKIWKTEKNPYNDEWFDILNNLFE